jgi:hypothetical protein
VWCDVADIIPINLGRNYAKHLEPANYCRKSAFREIGGTYHRDYTQMPPLFCT